jgi:hypothetical protein
MCYPLNQPTTSSPLEIFVGAQPFPWISPSAVRHTNFPVGIYQYVRNENLKGLPQAKVQDLDRQLGGYGQSGRGPDTFIIVGSTVYARFIFKSKTFGTRVTNSSV